MEKILGIDIGGTGIKGAIVDMKSGEFEVDKIKLKTPEPATPESMMQTVKELINLYEWENKPVGFGFPAIIKEGVCKSAANIDSSWIGLSVRDYFSNALGVQTNVINDADAAGLAELNYGLVRDHKGLIIFLTLGTGIGSGMFLDGKLIPNSELGHLQYKNSIAEKVASNKARKDNKLTWQQWGEELSGLLLHIDRLFSPNQIILGGGISKAYEEFLPFIDSQLPVNAASLFNNAGIIGAAMAYNLK
jgi:polyphosphate glucokinase